MVWNPKSETIVCSEENPDFFVPDAPKVLCTKHGKFLGVEKFSFENMVGNQDGREIPVLIMQEGVIGLYMAMTPAIARKIGQHLIDYAENEEEDAMQKLRDLLEKKPD